MLVAGFPATALATNCYLVAPAAGAECLVVDPGVGVGPRLAGALAEYRLRPAAVLLTHGHFDHTVSASEVCRQYRVPLYVHPADRPMVADPASGLPAEMAAAVAGLLGDAEHAEPDDVRCPADGDTLRLAGLSVTVDHAPGHTRGSVIYRLSGGVHAGAAELAELADATEVCLTGDVLFAGSIGRMDLPGGDAEAMAASLRRTLLSRADSVAVLPGHGPHSTIGRERRSNPYLVRLAADPAAGLPVG